MADLKDPDEVQEVSESNNVAVEALNEREFFLKFPDQLGAQ